MRRMTVWTNSRNPHVPGRRVFEEEQGENYANRTATIIDAASIIKPAIFPQWWILSPKPSSFKFVPL
jgi:hypothetical protein